MIPNEILYEDVTGELHYWKVRPMIAFALQVRYLIGKRCMLIRFRWTGSQP